VINNCRTEKTGVGEEGKKKQKQKQKQTQKKKQTPKRMVIVAKE
jgi:hypothetical protein